MKSRDEKQMLDLIIGTAQDDQNIRVIVLEGSRADPSARQDPLQDYDIIYGVRTLKPYVDNLQWIKRFGDLMIVQIPDGMGNTPRLEHKFTYLMQFVDGNRIDLNLYDVEYLKNHRFSSQSVVLLDKDNWLKLPPPSQSDYVPARPTAQQYHDCCNEFWWVVPYVAKGLWRQNMPYARHMLDNIIRCETFKMMDWYFGLKTDFLKSAEKFGRHYGRHLEADFCNLLAASYVSSNEESIWQALDNLCKLFRGVATKVGGHFDYPYPLEDDLRVSSYISHLRTLPRGSKQIY